MTATRREFLLLRPARHARVVELPCRRLYMRYVEARTAAGRVLDGDAGAGADPTGEPPSDVATPTVEELFAALGRELDEADSLRLVDPDWLTEPGFSQQVERVLDAFRARGGRVER